MKNWKCTFGIENALCVPPLVADRIDDAGLQGSPQEQTL